MGIRHSIRQAFGRRRSTPQLVWSGPEASGSAGNTGSVYKRLFLSAKRSVWVSSCYHENDKDIFGELARNLDTNPRLRVRLLLNIGRPKARLNETAVRRFADTFWKRWPGDHRPRLYYDPRSVTPQIHGMLHAKAVVADEERVFVTSANLTHRGWEDNVELGLLLRDRVLARGIVDHFRQLIDLEYLRRLPD